MGIFRRPAQQVRVHLTVNGREVTIEGALIRRGAVRGTYRLADAIVIEATTRSHSVGTVVIPATNVIFWQEVSSLGTRDLAEIVQGTA